MLYGEAIINSLASETIPFPHFRVDKSILERYEKILLEWFEISALWKPDFNDLYDLKIFNVHLINLPDVLGFIRESNTLDCLRRLTKKCFDVDLAEQVHIQANKLEYGQVIKIHTDYGSIGQSHRLLIHLNRGWTYEQGGVLMLLDSVSPEDINPDQSFILPKSGSATGFEISPKSFHAVTPVISGASYTLQYSFYPAH